MYTNQHIIDSVVIDIISTESDLLPNADIEYRDFFKFDIFELIDQVFDESCSKYENLKIDFIELDIGEVNKSHYKTEISKKIYYKLKGVLESTNKVRYTDSSLICLNDYDSDIEYRIIDKFLTYGHLPYIAHNKYNKSIDHIIENVVQNSPEKMRSIFMGLHREIVLRRLLYQCSTKSVSLICDKVDIFTIIDIQMYVREFESYLMHRVILTTNNMNINDVIFQFRYELMLSCINCYQKNATIFHVICICVGKLTGEYIEINSKNIARNIGKSNSILLQAFDQCINYDQALCADYNIINNGISKKISDDIETSSMPFLTDNWQYLYDKHKVILVESIKHKLRLPSFARQISHRFTDSMIRDLISAIALEDSKYILWFKGILDQTYDDNYSRERLSGIILSYISNSNQNFDKIKFTIHCAVAIGDDQVENIISRDAESVDQRANDDNADSRYMYFVGVAQRCRYRIQKILRSYNLACDCYYRIMTMLFSDSSEELTNIHLTNSHLRHIASNNSQLIIKILLLLKTADSKVWINVSRLPVEVLELMASSYKSHLHQHNNNTDAIVNKIESLDCRDNDKNLKYTKFLHYSIANNDSKTSIDPFVLNDRISNTKDMSTHKDSLYTDINTASPDDLLSILSRYVDGSVNVSVYAFRNIDDLIDVLIKYHSEEYIDYLRYHLSDASFIRRLSNRLTSISNEKNVLLLGNPRADEMLYISDCLAICIGQQSASVSYKDIDDARWMFIYEYLYEQGYEYYDNNFICGFIAHLNGIKRIKISQRHLISRLGDINKDTSSVLISNIIRTLSSNTNISNELSSITENTDNVEAILDDPLEKIYVNNAGLVLLAAYLPRLFDMSGLTADKTFKSRLAAERAVHMIQFLIDGQLDSPEFSLVLNKLLCGVRPGIPVVDRIKINDTEKNILESLLNSVISNWKALSSTSIRGLRESFLQRNGFLQLKDNAWYLKVEGKPYDMLLDKIGWSFSIVKYPWMDRTLYVEWR